MHGGLTNVSPLFFFEGRIFMVITIDWDPKEETICISEQNDTGESYHVSGNWPSVIDNVCACLHDYLECIDHKERVM